jgi:3-hydroxyacyl-CoA dehydrogenase/enoyl-CoA hydratase/3-hydroxybutyryl-CoA epimerase
VDYLVPRERMLEFARQHLFGDRTVKCRRAGPLKLWALNNRMVSTMTRSRVKQQLVKRTRGHYPAVTRALDLVTTSVHLSVALSLELERRAILELAATPEASNLIRLFLLQEKAKKRGTVPRVEATDSQSIRHTAVIGAGVMGSGIAHWVSSRGWPVILRDVGVEPVRKGMESIRRLYSDGVRRHSLTRLEARSGLDRISPAVGETPLGQVDLVIEAAVERLPEKKDIFAGLDSGDQYVRLVRHGNREQHADAGARCWNPLLQSGASDATRGSCSGTPNLDRNHSAHVALRSTDREIARIGKGQPGIPGEPDPDALPR